MRISRKTNVATEYTCTSFSVIRIKIHQGFYGHHVCYPPMASHAWKPTFHVMVLGGTQFTWSQNILLATCFGFFGNRPKCIFLKSHFGQNVWKYRLMNTAMASFSTTETYDRNVSAKIWPKCLSENKTACYFDNAISEKSVTTNHDVSCKSEEWISSISFRGVCIRFTNPASCELNSLSVGRCRLRKFKSTS